MPDDWTIPESYWVVIWSDVRTYVDPEQAQSLRQQFEAGKTMLECEDIFGSTNWIPADRLGGVWDSTPTMRARSEAHSAMLKREHPFAEDS